LFSEIISHTVHEIKDEHLEVRLHRLGLDTGRRSLALFHLRDRPFRRETSPLSLLQFIAQSVWRGLFQKGAEVMSTDSPNEFYLVDRGMILNRYISVSVESAEEGSMVNCSNFAAGIIEGMLKTAGFEKVKVDAAFTHSGIDIVSDPGNVTFIVRIGTDDDKVNRRSII
jgi:hypothetical protein